MLLIRVARGIFREAASGRVISHGRRYKGRDLVRQSELACLVLTVPVQVRMAHLLTGRHPSGDKIVATDFLIREIGVARPDRLRDCRSILAGTRSNWRPTVHCFGGACPVSCSSGQ
jgi:hypothetical protein